MHQVGRLEGCVHPRAGGFTWAGLAFYPGMGTMTASWGAIPPPLALASVPLMGRSPASGAGTTAVSWSVPQPIPTSQPISSSQAVQTPQSSQAVGSVGAAALPFSLSPATEPFPHKLVAKVKAGQFVEMRELLSDNISLLHQLDAVNMQCLPLPGVLKPRLREVNTLPSWLYCFLAYMAIRSSDPAMRDMLAYARLVIREAQRHGGVGWLDYDRVFRQQAALDGTLQWNTIHPGIQAATLVGRTAKPGLFCTLCRESDHSTGDCALGYLQPTLMQPLRPAMPTQRPAAQKQHPSARKETVCFSWNAGNCRFPGSCHFRHLCSRCNQPHRVQDCPQAGAGRIARLATPARSGN